MLIVDDFSNCSFSFFLKQKSDLPDTVLLFIADIKKKLGYTVKFIRCDNAGENRVLEQRCKQEGLGIGFKFTAPNTPQQNGRIERRFATLYGRIRAMLDRMGLDNPLKSRLWCEAASLETDYDGEVVRPNQLLTSFQKFFGKGVKSNVDVTKIFGEMIIVANQDEIKGKFAIQRKPCLWMGFAPDHPQGTYRAYDLKTKKVILSRDVTFFASKSQ